MKSFREWLREADEKEVKKEETSEYKQYFKKILAKYNVEDPSELSKEDRQKFFDEVDAGWKGDYEKKEVNEAISKYAKTIVDKLDLRNIINIIDAELDKVNDRDNLYSSIIEELLNKLNKSIK